MVELLSIETIKEVLSSNSDIERKELRISKAKQSLKTIKANKGSCNGVPCGNCPFYPFSCSVVKMQNHKIEECDENGWTDEDIVNLKIWKCNIKNMKKAIKQLEKEGHEKI